MHLFRSIRVTITSKNRNDLTVAEAEQLSKVVEEGMTLFSEYVESRVEHAVVEVTD